MEILTAVLPIVINILLIVLITVFIIVGIKIIQILNKTQEVVDDIQEKVSSFNAFFAIINGVNERFGLITEKVYGVIEGLISKLLHRKDKEDDEESFDEEIEQVKPKKRRRR